MARTKVLLGALVVLGWAGETIGADATVQLSGLPEDLTLPLRAGTNAILTATVRGGEVRSVWIAPRADSKARYLLSPAGEGQFQVNLADRMLSAILGAWEGEPEFRVFAETAAGTMVESIGVRYAASKPAGKPPRIFVHAGGKRKEIIRRLPEGIFEDLGMRAHLSGSDLWVFPTVPPSAFASGGVGDAYCFSPDEVDHIEVRYERDAHRPAAEARVGERTWTFRAGKRSTLRLTVTEEMRKAWNDGGEMEVVTSEGGGEETSIILKAVPSRLDLPGGKGEVTIVQRSSKEMPGSAGFLRVYVSDITGGQALVSVMARDGRRVVEERSLRKGEEVRFQLGDENYRLKVEKLQNFLIGDDFAVVSVSRAETGEIEVAREREKIGRLLQIVAKSDSTFLRSDTEYAAPDAADYLRRKYEVVRDEVFTLDDFIEGVGSRSWITGRDYRVRTPEGKELPSREWLREKARTMDVGKPEIPAAEKGSPQGQQESR